MIVKLQESIDQLDGNLNRLNEIYAAGAVEGFDEKTLAPSDQGVIVHSVDCLPCHVFLMSRTKAGG
jgi:hypothetical protein